MTEAVPHNTGEDVLSSIRRLVAHDAPSPEQAKPLAQEKLLLTAALRVHGPELDSAEAEAEADFGACAVLEDIRPQHDAYATVTPDSVSGPVSGSVSVQNESLSTTPAPFAALREEPQAGAHMPQDTGSFAQSVEDRALEATLARLEAVLSGTARASGAETVDDGAEPLEDVIDEGMLYQLVAHIVRQELQGELGEKITRNIRKLVRAEVARELQLRQL
ncbi:MAG: hypothetical protein LAT78_08225 [Roseinatronobacter sp.]|nr:hypothetical protein [Roseinatronobacter sp.]